MKNYKLKDALFVCAIICGIVSSIGRFDIPFWVFIALFIVYAFLRYTDKTVILK